MRDNGTADAGADDGHGEDGAAGVRDDVLGTPDLLALDGVVPKGGGPPVRDRIGGVSLGRPLAYALRDPARRRPTADADRDFLVCFPFDLEELPDGRRYEQATLTVDLADGLHALSLDPAPGTVAADGTEISVFGLGRQRLRWTFRARGRGAGLRPDGRWAQAVVRMPASSAEVSGRVSLSTTTVQPVLGGALRRRAAETPYDTPFRIRAGEAWQTAGPLTHQGVLPGAWALAAYQDEMPHPEHREDREADDGRLPPGLRRLCLAVDIERYSARDNADMVRLQRVLLRTLRAACERVGVDWERCGRQAQGDGYLLVLEPDVDETRVVPGLLAGLTAGLAAANARTAGANSAAGKESSAGGLGSVRMRASLHQGIVHEADSGYAGSAVVALFRVLDSGPVRRFLAESRDTDLVAAFSDTLYQDLVGTGYEGLSAAGFEKVEIEIAAKNFTGVAWVRAMRSAAEH
ncbi:hypothetical protein [Streptomyces sp. NBC_01451]|uniref:hypothetical protein n=1 Tax=Streptomyces sp. NBC_01451 TaxID=2903872 RepID=UPI002E2F4AD0|nr:hypothetical protein [Streptomyces sp. NBC_01451]